MTSDENINKIYLKAKEQNEILAVSNNNKIKILTPEKYLINDQKTLQFIDIPSIIDQNLNRIQS